MSTRTWNIDTTHSTVGFTVRHLVITKVHGQFGTWSGQLLIDDEDLSRSSVKVEIDLASVDTKEAKRDAHLRSADFFDVDHHPKMTFASKRVVVEDGEIAQVIGDLTIRGTTHEVTLKVEESGRAKDPWGGERVAFSARTRINRADYGLTWNMALEAGGFVVGDKVDIQLDLEAVLAQATAAVPAKADSATVTA
jgi:polyisoprenoid-binding protein YceI